MTSVAVLMDGNNVLGCLSRVGLGYPHLGRLIPMILGGDSLSYARFYAAPPINAPAGLSRTNYYAHWMRFAAANRAVPGLDFYHGYRDRHGKEKSVDVALAVDLVLGSCTGSYDRIVVVGGDGDHQYAVARARVLCPVDVVIFERQKYWALKQTGAPIRILKRADLIAQRVCNEGNLSPVPA